MAELQEVRVPDIGAIDEVTVVEVLVKVGDTVEAETSLISLESDKASMEVPSPAAGVVKEIKVKAGDKVGQDAPILVLEVAGGAPAAAPAAQPAAPLSPWPPRRQISRRRATGPARGASPARGAAPSPRRQPNRRRSRRQPRRQNRPRRRRRRRPPSRHRPSPPRRKPSAGRRRRRPQGRRRRLRQGLRRPRGAQAGPRAGRRPRPGGRRRPQGQDHPRSQGLGPRSARRLAARWWRGRRLRLQLAADAGDRLQQVRPGRGGGGGGGGGGQVPLSRIRKLSAASLHRSWLHAPHVTQFEDADITELEAFRKAHGEEAQKRGVKLTPLALVMKAVAAALRELPDFNSSLDPPPART